LLTKNEGKKEKLNIYGTFLSLNASKSLFLKEYSFIISNIVLYLVKKTNV